MCSDLQDNPFAHEDKLNKIQEHLKIEYNFFSPGEIIYNAQGRPTRRNRQPPVRLVMPEKFIKNDSKNQQYREERVAVDLQKFDDQFKECDLFNESDLEEMEREDKEIEAFENIINENEFNEEDAKKEIEEQEKEEGDEDSDSESQSNSAEDDGAHSSDSAWSQSDSDETSEPEEDQELVKAYDLVKDDDDSEEDDEDDDDESESEEESDDSDERPPAKKQKQIDSSESD